MSPEDSSLLLKLKVELRVNPRTAAFAKQLQVSMNRRTAILEGTVPSDVDRKTAERVAMTVPGVLRVSNKLQLPQ